MAQLKLFRILLTDPISGANIDFIIAVTDAGIDIAVIIIIILLLLGWLCKFPNTVTENTVYIIFFQITEDGTSNAVLTYTSY